MANLNNEQRAYLKQLLDDRYQALGAELDRETTGKDSFADVASDVSDPGDTSFANLEIDLANAETTRDLDEVRAIDAARARMQDGSYGSCIDCGIDIPYARLQAQPTASRCVPCQETYDKTHADGGRGATI